MSNKKKVLLAMSGGVDSSAAAVCLQNAGYECVGATMLMQDSGESGAEDARAVANTLGMEFSVFERRNSQSLYRVQQKAEIRSLCGLCKGYWR